MLEIGGVTIRKYIVESLAMMEGDHPLTPKQVARCEGVSRSAIYKRRERLEKRIGYKLPRRDKRGRKPKSPVTQAA